MSIEVTVAGRIEHSEQYKGRWYVIVITPALDAYSAPSRFKLVHEYSLGAVGEEISVRCSLRGYLRRREWTDPQNGQVRQIRNVDVVFTVIPDAPPKPGAKAAPA